MTMATMTEMAATTAVVAKDLVIRTIPVVIVELGFIAVVAEAEADTEVPLMMIGTERNRNRRPLFSGSLGSNIGSRTL